MPERTTLKLHIRTGAVRCIGWLDRFGSQLPSLQWAGKAERTSFEVPTVSLHVHERIDPRSIIEAVRQKNGSDFEQLSLFNPSKNPPLREAVEFYKHNNNWSNRLIAGDSLLVMNSLIDRPASNMKVRVVDAITVSSA